MKRFWDLVADSIITQSIITILLVGMACYLWYKYQVIPDRLWTAVTFVLGFFFGAKVQQVIRRSK